MKNILRLSIKTNIKNFLIKYLDNIIARGTEGAELVCERLMGN